MKRFGSLVAVLAVILVPGADGQIGRVTRTLKVGSGAGGFGGTVDPGDGIGEGATAIGDLDGDGVPDLAVGAPDDDEASIDDGAVWILFLNTDGTVKSEQKISAAAGGFGGVLDAGDEWHGSTVHFVTEELDGGPRILQGRLRVNPDESADQLQHRVQAIEHRIYPEAAGLFGSGRVRFRDGKTWIDGEVASEPLVRSYD